MSEILKRFMQVDNEVLGLRPGLVLVEVPNSPATDEVKLGNTGVTLEIAKPKTHKLNREAKKAFFVRVLTADEETGLEPGNIVLTSKNSLTVFSVYGHLEAKEDTIALMEANGFMQKFKDKEEYKRVMEILNNG